MAIDKFREEYYFLSNMYPLVEGVVHGRSERVVSTTEHAYQADKFVDQDAALRVLDAKDGFKAKRAAKKLTEAGAEYIPDWQERKFDIMRGYVRQKFDRDPQLQRLLLRTGTEELIEGNEWGDTYWGVSPRGSGIGENRMGNILMDVRSEIRMRNRAGYVLPLPAHDLNLSGIEIVNNVLPERYSLEAQVRQPAAVEAEHFPKF